MDRDEIQREIGKILGAARPAAVEERAIVIQETAAACGITSVLYAYIRDQYGADQVEELDTAELARTFSFIRVAAEMAREEDRREAL